MIYASCGVLLGTVSKRFDTIAKFTDFEGFISFEEKGKNEVKWIENNKVKGAVEADMVCEVV